MRLNEYKERIVNLNVEKLAIESLSMYTDEMADLNREQLMSGFLSDGKRMQVYRHNWYAEKKNEMNPIPGFGTPDLKLTGATHRSITYEVNNKFVNSLVNDVYLLEEKYSTTTGNPFKLTLKSKDIIKTFTQYQFIDLIKKQIWK